MWHSNFLPTKNNKLDEKTKEHKKALKNNLGQKQQMQSMLNNNGFYLKKNVTYNQLPTAFWRNVLEFFERLQFCVSLCNVAHFALNLDCTEGHHW